MPEEPKFLNKTKTLSEIIGALILPAVLAWVGLNYTRSHDEREETRQEIDKAQQLIAIMDRLEDGTIRRREGALLLVKHYATNCDDAEIIVPVLFDGLTDPDDKVKSDTDKVLKSVHVKCAKLREEIETGWAAQTDEPEEKAEPEPSSKASPLVSTRAIPSSRATPSSTHAFASATATPSNVSAHKYSDFAPRVYIHIQRDDQSGLAQRIEDALELKGVLVPKIIMVDFGPSKSQLRFFRDQDQQEAKNILKDVPNGGGVQLQRIKGYENSTNIRPHHFELWLAPG